MKTSSTSRTRRRIAGVAAMAAASALVVPSIASSASADAPSPTTVTVTRLGAPAGQTTTLEQPKNIVLSWAGVRGATGYRVEIGTDDQWSDVPTLSQDTVSTRLEVPTWLPHASYFWRVAALSGTTVGRWTATTNATTFTRSWDAGRPTPLTPAASESPVFGRPTFSWTPVTTASAYEVQVSTSPTFNEKGLPTTAPTTDNAPTQDQNQPVVNTCFTARNRVTPFTEQASHGEDNPGPCVFTVLGRSTTPVYWRVRALDRFVGDANDTDTTPASTEGISHLPPSPEPNDPNLVSACPTPGASSAASPSPSPSPSASTSATASSSASPSGSPSPSPSPSPAAAAGETSKQLDCAPSHPVEKGPWSATTRFVTAYPAPTADDTGRYRTLAPVVTKPLPSDLCDAGGVCRDFPTITWDAVTGADRYRVYVALDPSYSNIQRMVETSGLEWTPNDAWRDSKAGQAYYYVVQPCTVTGSQAGCGAVTPTPPSFRKVSPKPQLAGPDDGLLRKGGGITFSWADWASTQGANAGAACAQSSAVTACPGEAYAYRVQVAKADNPDFQPSELVDDMTSDTTSYTSSVKSYPDGDLLWRVQAVDSSAHGLPWSVARKLRLDSTPPSALVRPGTAASVSGPLQVVFSEAVRNVSGGSISVPGASVAVSAVGPTSATLTPTRPLIPGQTYAVTFGSGITDLAGNQLSTVTSPVSVNPMADDRSAAIGYAGSWRSMASSNAIAGTFHASAPTASSPTAATFSSFGSGVLVTGCMGPNNGAMKVYVDGVLKASRDTYRSFSGCGVNLVRITGLSKSAHRVQVRGMGTKGAASKGTLVALDAITALP